MNFIETKKIRKKPSNIYHISNNYKNKHMTK